MPLFILVIFAAIVALDVAWWLVADRLARQLPRARLWRWGVAAFAAAQLGLVAVTIGTRAFPGVVLPAFVSGLAIVWHLILLPLTVVAYVLLVPAGLWATRTRPTPEAEPDADADAADAAPSMSRRAFVGLAVATPPVAALSAAGLGLWQIEHFRVRRLDVPIAGLPPALEGATIAHVSDTHVGEYARGDLLGRIADAVNALDADLVVHTGDLVNHDLAMIPAAADMMNAMRGRAGGGGVYVVEGNHDLFDGRRAFLEPARAAGMDVLSNDVRRVEINGHPVDLLGLRWGGVPGVGGVEGGRSYERGDEALAASFGELAEHPDRRADAFPVLLAHHPHAFDVARPAGVPLTLSGHTHGGQLMLPGGVGFGPLMYRYYSGLYTAAGAAAVISNGTGNWFPLRTFAPAEILHLTLRGA